MLILWFRYNSTKDRDAIVKLLEKEKEKLVTKSKSCIIHLCRKRKENSRQDECWREILGCTRQGIQVGRKELQSKKSTGLVAENASGTKETKDQDLQKAKERLETLLDYQATGKREQKL